METIKVSKSECKAKALEFFRQVEHTGQSVIITDHGRPALEVRPCRSQVFRPLALLRGTVVRYDVSTVSIGENDWEAVR